jgi:hypothetical protein
MGLEDGIVIFGGDALARAKGLTEPGGLPREGILDAELAGEDIAKESNSTGIGNALAGAGHGKSSIAGFREIAKNGHYIHLGFRIAAPNPGNGGCRPYPFDSYRNMKVNGT